MRMSLMLFSATLLIAYLAPAGAYAHESRYSHRYYGHRYYTERYSYDACHCHFGYNEKSPGECAVQVACMNEGGRCWSYCPPIQE
jgi:hypothetical protein